MSNLFNVNSGSIDNLVVSSSLQALEKITIKDKNVEELLVLDQYGSLYFDTSNDMGVDPGSNNFRIGANSWDQQSTGIITVSTSSIDATKQQKYLQLLNTLSSTGVAGYQIQLTSATDTSTYKRFEITKVEKQLTYVRFYVQELASGWNALRLSQLPNDGEEFTVGFDVPANQVQRFEFTANMGTNKVIYDVSASLIRNWTPPAWTNKMTVICVGAGGGGGGGANGHVLISNQYLVTGGGGGAGGNIAINEFTRNQIIDSNTGQMKPCDIYIGRGGIAGEGGWNAGAHLVLDANYWNDREHSYYYSDQYCHQRWDKIYQVGSGLSVAEMDPEWPQYRTSGNKAGQIFRRDIGVGWNFSTPANRAAMNLFKYGGQGEDGGFSLFGIKDSESDSLNVVELLSGINQDINRQLLATGGEGGKGGWVSEYNAYPDRSDPNYNPIANYTPCSTVDVTFNGHLHSDVARNDIKKSKNYIRGGKASIQNSFGKILYLGGPGGQGSVPNIPKSMSKKDGYGRDNSKFQMTIDDVENGFIGDMSNEDHAVKLNNTATAPLFPWGKTISFGPLGEIWSEKELPYNTSFETPGYFGCPGGGGGAGTSFHDVWSLRGQINQNLKPHRNYFLEHQYIDDIKITGQEGSYSDEYIVDCPVRYYPNPAAQVTFGGANTVQTEIYGIPIVRGGSGGYFSVLQNNWTYGSSLEPLSINSISNEAKIKYGGGFFEIAPATLGEGYGVGGGGGAGHHVMYGMTRTIDWYRNQVDQNMKTFWDFKTTKWEERLTWHKNANLQFVRNAASGSSGNDGIVVVICES